MTRTKAPRLWSLKELAAVMGITPDSLRQRIARGTLPATKLGRDWFVSDVEAARVIGQPPGTLPTADEVAP